jgi:hypothetical protein
MGATEEQMAMLNEANVTHVSYILLLYSVAFILYLCKLSLSTKRWLSNAQAVVNMLLHVYISATWPANEPVPFEQRRPRANGHANGHIQSERARQHVRDAEEFELEGLMSDGESPTPNGHAKPLPREPEA